MENANEILVPAYFLFGTVSMLFIAQKFITAKKMLYKNFGYGLGLYSAALAVWTLLVILKPEEIDTWTTIGAVPFGLAHVFFLLAAVDKVKSSTKFSILSGGAVYLAVLVVLRATVLDSNPGFSDAGLFYFNADPVIIAMYIGAFAGTFLPALGAVSKSMRDKLLSGVTRNAFTVLVLSSVVLVSSRDEELLLIVGWAMGLSYLALVSVFYSRKVK